MNTVQSTFSSPRNQRIIFWAALAVLAAGIVFLVIKLVGGSDTATKVQPDKGFKPALPQKQQPLTTADGAKITSYAQLPADVKETIRGFIVPGVINQNYGASWKYTAPNLTDHMSQQKYASVDARSIIPLPGYTYKGAKFELEEATANEVMLTIRLQPSKPSVGRMTPMRMVLAPYGKGAQRHWLVNYWLPATNRAPLPYGGDG